MSGLSFIETHTKKYSEAINDMKLTVVYLIVQSQKLNSFRDNFLSS